MSGSFTANDCKLSDSTAIQLQLHADRPHESGDPDVQHGAGPYLFLADADLNVIDEDDDGDGGSNARIMRTLQPGRYEIITNVYNPNTYGAYQMTLRTAPAVYHGTRVHRTADVVGQPDHGGRRLNDGSYQDRYDINVTTRAIYRVMSPVRPSMPWPS